VIRTVGGNIFATFVFLPSLRRISIPLDRVATFSRTYDLASKIYASISTLAGLSFSTAAYYAPTNYLQKSMIASAVLSFSVAPMTLLVIMPTVKALKAIESAGDTVKANSEGDKLIEKWGNLSLIRWSLMTVAALNGLKELSELYLL
jgi:Domain of unknown function (DUF1772)